MKNYAKSPIKAFRATLFRKNDFDELNTVLGIEFSSESVYYGSSGKTFGHLVQPGETIFFVAAMREDFAVGDFEHKEVIPAIPHERFFAARVDNFKDSSGTYEIQVSEIIYSANTPESNGSKFKMPDSKSAPKPGAEADNPAPTPIEQYIAKVTSAVQKKWNDHPPQIKDSLKWGRVRLRFFMKTDGKPHNITVISEEIEGNSTTIRRLMTRAILDATMPEMPREVLTNIKEEGVKIELEAVVY